MPDAVGVADGGRVAELSRAALRYGQALGALPEPTLAMRLYDFGRRPVTLRLRRRLPDPSAVAALVDAAGGAVLRRDWRELPSTPHWRRWAPAGGPGSVGGKLYVSVAPDALAQAVAAVAGLGRGRGVAAFKVAADPAGVCRPDRLVLYASAREALPALAAVLRERLAGCPADGVPFTAALTPDGLLSWAVDPRSGGSWRQWLTARVARHLCAAADAGAAEPWRFALERVRLDGVDTARWEPVAG